MRPVTVLSYEEDDMPRRVAIYRARCGTDECILLFYMYRGAPYAIVVPARPSPLCGLVDLENARIISRIVTDLGITSTYLPACRVSSRLLRSSIKETINTLISLGLIDEIV